MSDPSRVAVYVDFDNVVISYYDNVFGDGTWRRDDARWHAADGASADPIDFKLSQAAVDLGAIIDLVQLVRLRQAAVRGARDSAADRVPTCAGAAL